MVRVLPWLLLACSQSRCGPEPVAGDSSSDSAPTSDTADSSDTAPPDTGDSGDTGDSALPDTAETGDTAPPEPPDADVDGHVDEASGGDDCDDQNAHVYPGAPEMCDDADQDCDGDGWLGADCGSTQNIAAMGVLLTGSPYGVPRIVRDVTGDGVSDIQDGDYREIEPLGRAYWTATSIPENPGTFPADNNVAAFYEYEDLMNHRLDFGDVDGDGFNDVGHVPGGVYGYETQLYKGPIPTDGTWVPTYPSDYQWDASPGIDWEDCWSCDAITGDWNGDGLGDLALAAWDDVAPEEDGGLVVYWGGTFGDDRTKIDGGWVRDLHPIGDVTGDGIDDILVDDDCESAVTACSDLLDGTDLADVADLPQTSDLAAATFRDTSYESSTWSAVADWDGDGVNDLAVNAWPEEGSAGENNEWLILPGPYVGTAAIADAPGGYEMEGTPLDSGPSIWTRRCGLGGADNLLLRGQQVWLVMPDPHSLPPRHSALPDRAVVVEESSSVDCGDVTGDGADDLVFGVQEDWMDGDQIRIIPGWEIPWDDDTYWP